MTAVDHAELKRVAEGATPKVWKPFWGDAVQAVMCARTDKEVVFWSGFDASRTATTKAKKVALMNFIAAANPAVVLALLSEIEGLKAERRNIVSHATMGTTDGEGLSVNQVSVEITRLRNELYARTPAPDSWRPDREFAQSVADVEIEDIDLEYAVVNLLHGRGALDKKTKTDAVVAIKTLRDILSEARALRPQTAESGE